MHCSNNLKQIALALHNYHDTYKTFPPAYFTDKNGHPAHSWRVLILPFLEEQSLYDSYDFDEPWDGPNNLALMSQMPAIYACPIIQREYRKPNTYTNYVAVIGNDTAWPGDRAIAFRDILDGASNTLLVCEAPTRPIQWTEPVDIEYADAIEVLTADEPHRRKWHHVSGTFFYEWSSGRHAALADGSVRFLAQGIDADDTARLLNRRDGEPIDFDQLDRATSGSPRLRVGNCIRLGVFLLLCLWPLPWVWINPQKTVAVTQAEADDANNSSGV